MFVVGASLNAVKGKEKELERELREMIPPTKREAGNITYILHRATDDPCAFFFYEQYRSKEDFDAHLASAHFKKLIATIQPWLAQPPQISTYEKLAETTVGR